MKFCYYLLFINLFSFVIYGIDKFLARKNMRRISEKFLFFLGALGGMAGSILGMLFWHHKTKKIYFYILNISFLIIWLIIIWRCFF